MVGTWGRWGTGGPATAGKRWPHFFQMGKLRHKFGNLPNVTHSESAFGGDWRQLTLRNTLRVKDRQEEPGNT